MTRDVTKGLWKPKSQDEIQRLYADWADSYDKDVTDWGYATPARVAHALRGHLGDLSLPVLDFGCGTGLSGMALHLAGFDVIDGTDVSPEMIAKCQKHEFYRTLWHAEPGPLDVPVGAYAAVAATGVVSLGAAPPETLDMVLDVLMPGGLLGFSFNDPTLEDATYMAALSAAQESGKAQLIYEDYGDHLPGKGLKSMVYVLERR